MASPVLSRRLTELLVWRSGPLSCVGEGQMWDLELELASYLAPAALVD